MMRNSVVVLPKTHNPKCTDEKSIRQMPTGGGGTLRYTGPVLLKPLKVIKTQKTQQRLRNRPSQEPEVVMW